MTRSNDRAGDGRDQGRHPDDPGNYDEHAKGNARRTAQKPGKREVKIIMGTDVMPRPISWLWPDWLAHGKLHILAGRPGCLKTTTAIGFAAGVTVGG